MTTSLSDHDAIRQVVARYARGVDRLDADVMKSAYWPEATDDHGVFVGNAMVFCERVVETHKRFAGTMHCNMNHAIEVERRAPGQRWLIVSVALEYIAEAHFPEHVEIASGILRIGNSSWDIASAAFQGGECKATCITTIVLTDANGPTAIPQDLRGEFERLHVKSA